MSELLRRMLSVYMDEATDGTEGGGGGSGESDLDETKGENEVKATPEDKGTEKPKVTDAEAKLLKEVMNKKAALEKTKSELDAVKAKIKELEELGGFEAVSKLARQQKDLEAQKLEEKGEWTRLKQQMNDEHGKVLNEKVEALNSVKSENQVLLNKISDLTVGTAFATSKFINEDLIMPVKKVRVLYGDHFEFKDGVVVAYDKPVGQEERTMLVDAQGDPLSFEAAMAKIIDADPDREHLLKSKAKPGAGSGTNPKTKKADDIEKLHGHSRIAAAITKGDLKDLTK